MNAMLCMSVGLPGAALLAALAAGYFVCLSAKKERGVMKAVGYAIGIAIIVAAGLLILNGLIGKVKFYNKMTCRGMGTGMTGMMKEMPISIPKK
ncbi:MAG: hypothetical protein WCL25_05860 [bacterium]